MSSRLNRPLHLNAIHFTTHDPQQRAALMGLVFALYTLLFSGVHLLIGPSAGPLVVFPVIYITWILGTRAGLIACIVSFALNAILLALLNNTGLDAILRFGGVPGAILLFPIAYVIGRMRELSYELRRVSDELERRVSERTAALEQSNRELQAQVAERQRIETELRRALVAERSLVEMKSRFGTLISHEFRTPLSVIMTSSDILKRYRMHITESRSQEYLDTIQKQVKHLSGLLDDLMLLSRAETVGLEFRPMAFDLEAFCREIVTQMQNAYPNHEMIYRPQVLQPAVLDSKLLRLVIVNLLANAAKYSPAGGVIFFDVSSQGDTVTLRVEDQGIGISAEDQQQLFQMFSRGSNVGTITGLGLGLAIIRLAVEMHKGTITLWSEIGKGTAFTIHLPRIASSGTGKAE